jgi:hypoxanthine phosphoribosyltransferase
MVIKDLNFKKFIASAKIQKTVESLAARISTDYKGRTPTLLPILNGSFIFAADLIKELDIDCRVSFVKVSSYSGTMSTGQLKSLIGHEESVFGQEILIIEDTVDSGMTLQRIMDELKALGAKSVHTVSLLRKKVAREKKVDVKYVGFDIEEEFVLGYGLDYDGLGRNYKDLYIKG